MRGWEVSCDARLFAGEYPGCPVITFGAGQLEPRTPTASESTWVISSIVSSSSSCSCSRETGTIQ